MKAEIRNNSLVYKGKRVLVDDLLDEDFYKYSNSIADKFYNSSYGVNEVFMNLVQPYLAINRWVANNHPGRIYLVDSKLEYKFYAKDICKGLHIELFGFSWWLPLWIKLRYFFTVLTSAFYILYLLLRIPYKKEFAVAPKFTVLRTKAAIKKFKKFGEIHQEIEDFKDKSSVYRLFPITKRTCWVAEGFRNSFRTMNQMTDFYKVELGDHFRYALMAYYEKRILYAEVYRQMMDDYLSLNKGSVFYTGNNLDRFSVIEDELCKKYGISSYCIPHGIEYGFKFPKGFSCDIFYVHSQYTADYLNKLYETNKYVYDESVIRRMFEYNYNKPHKQLIIFFTESREVNVNIEIVKGLLPKMKERGLELFLKLHPKDAKENYNGLDVSFITDYDLSLTGNICISRKSTILIEAIYNNSIPVAIITNPKDKSLFNTFPSLNAKQIIKTYSVEDLFDVIKTNIH